MSYRRCKMWKYRTKDKLAKCLFRVTYTLAAFLPNQTQYLSHIIEQSQPFLCIISLNTWVLYLFRYSSVKIINFLVLYR